MARTADVNVIYVSAAEAVFTLKQKLKAAGWTVPTSGDGNAVYSASSDIITTYTLLSGVKAWFVIREPGGRREYMFQRGSSDAAWRIKYSALARFITGGSAGNTPAATDEQYLAGGGTDAAPVYATSYFTTAGTYRCHIITESTPVNGAYFFAMYGTTITTGATNFSMIADPIQAGSHSVEDADPIAFNFSPYNSLANWKGWLYFGSAAPVWSTALLQSGFGPAGGGGVPDPAGRDPVIAMFYYTATVWKGIGSFVKYRTITARVYPNTINKATDCYAYWGDRYVLPFKNATDPAL